MPSLNSVHIIGHLGKEPELRFTPNGKATASFSVAVSESRKVGEDWKKETEWFNVTTWNQTAEWCNENLVKGSLVFVVGKLKTRSWEAQDGQKKYKTELIANQVLLLDKREKQEQASEDDGELPF
jgi:single-strand DNA-binding protein